MCIRDSYHTYYLSNYGERIRREASKELSFLSHMDGGIMSYTVHLAKPDPAIYQTLLDRYGLKAEECVFLAGHNNARNTKSLRCLYISHCIIQKYTLLCLDVYKRQLLDLSTKYGFDKNLWHNYLTFILLTNENSFSMTSEKVGANDGTVNHFAKADFAVFKKLFDFDFGPIEEALGIDCFTTVCNYKAIQKKEHMYCLLYTSRCV